MIIQASASSSSIDPDSYLENITALSQFPSALASEINSGNKSILRKV